MEALDALLAACLSNDTQAIKAAEVQLKELCAQPAVVPELLLRLGASPSPEVRQLATVMLRKRITKHWAKLSEQERAHVQQALLERLVAEAHSSVRRSLGDLVGVLARHTVPKGQWPGLLAFLAGCSSSAEAAHREVALQLLGSLAEHVGDMLAGQVGSLVQVVGAGLRDASPEVRRAALKAMEPLAGLVQEAADVEAYHQLVAAMLEVGAAAHASGDEESLVLACGLLVELCEASAPLLARCLPGVVALALGAGCDARLDLAARERALQVLHWVARFKPKQLSRNKELVRQVVTALCTMAAEAPPPDLDPDDDDVLPPNKMATQALDALALHVSAQHIYPVVLAFAREAMPSQQPNAREAALSCLAVIAEGCAEPLRKPARLRELLGHLLQGLRDPDTRVRGAAALGIGMASEFLQPEIVEHYKEVLPLLFPLMTSSNADVCERACYALDTFTEALEKAEILPYLPQLVAGLGSVLGSSGPSVQELALSALASVVSASGPAFEPYVDAVLPALHHFMAAHSSELLACRCRATETLGLMFDGLSATCPAQLRQLAPGLMQMGLQGFTVDHPELREYGHGMFSCIAKALGKDFEPYLAAVVPLAMQSCALDDGAFDGDEDEGTNNDHGGDHLEEDDEDDDSDEGGRGRMLSVRTGVLDEKCAATSALGYYATACPSAFMPYLPQALDMITKGAGGMCRYFHEEVRLQAAEALPRLVLAVYMQFPPRASAAAGQPDAAVAAGPALELSPELKHVLDLALQELNRALQDVDLGVTTAALHALTLLLKQLGVEVLGGQQLLLMATTASEVLKGEANCQVAAREEEEEGAGGGEEDDDEAGDAEEELLGAVADLLPAFASCVPPEQYAPVFEREHLPALLSRLKPQQPDDVRSMMVGSLAEVAERLQAHLAPHLGKLVPLLVRELRCEDAVNRQNAAFCLGVLAQGCGGAAMTAHYPSVLQALHPLFGAGESAGTRDNALGCVARMMLADAGASGLPLEAVLPTFLAGLPLREDLSEAEPVYGALCGLLTGAQAPRVAGLVPQVVAEFGLASVQRPGLPSKVVAQVARTLDVLSQQFPQHMGPLVAALPLEQQQALSAAAAFPAGA